MHESILETTQVCDIVDEEGGKLHELLFPSGEATTGGGLNYAILVSFLREVGAGSGSKFTSVGCSRAALAARIAFDYDEVIACCSPDPRSDEVVRARFLKAVAPRLSRSQLQHLKFLHGSGGGLTREAVAGSTTIFLGGHWLASLAGGPPSDSSGDGGTSSAVVGALAASLAPGTVVISEGAELFEDEADLLEIVGKVIFPISAVVKAWWSK